MREDIRFSKNAATLTHDSARGKVKRNAGNFTRGSQLFHHEVLMTWAGVKLPLYTWIATTAVLLFALGAFTFKNHEIHLVIMRCLATVWNWIGLNPDKAVNLTLPSGQIVQGHMPMVPYHPAVQAAWATAIRITVSSMLGAAFICVPLTVWFVDFSRRRGSAILTERHERGAIMVNREILADAIRAHNWREHSKECLDRDPPDDPKAVLQEDLKSRIRRGIHSPALLQTWGTAARRHPVGGLGSIGEMLIEHNHGFGQGRGSNSECSFNQAHLPHDTWLQAPCLGLSFA